MYKKSTKMQIVLALWIMLVFVISGCGEQNIAEKTETITEEETEFAQETSEEETTDTEDDFSASDFVALEKEYKAAYLNVIRENEAAINQYDWQYSSDSPTPISLIDVTGDDVPELIYMAAEDSYSASLHICTYQEGEAKELFAETWDVNEGGGCHYILFQLKGNNRDLYTRFETGDEWRTTTYSKYGYDASGNYTTLRTLEETAAYNDDYSDMVYEYTDNAKETTKETYQNETQALLDSIRMIILYNDQINDSITELIGNTWCNAKTYSEAEEYFLSEGIKKIDMEAVYEESVISSFLAFNHSFTLSSGAEEWSTWFTLHDDLTFDGGYRDSDKGDIGEGYARGTVYLNHFHGSFTDIKMVNDYTFSMQLADIELDQDPGTEWIDSDTRFIASAPLGMQNTGDFLLYLPRASMDELPEEFVNWVAWQRAGRDDDTSNTLNGYGLYNVDGQFGFYAP